MASFSRATTVASDDNMLPDSMKGFAPTIHGIARSNASDHSGGMSSALCTARGVTVMISIYRRQRRFDNEVKENPTVSVCYNGAIPPCRFCNEGRLEVSRRRWRSIAAIVVKRR
ncbi:fimbria/pilus outer membrane usher protein [Salmonella enterica subsp. enterica]|nr:fimbria/pilus outer membrane usher protein [Salmonella enterica subsp. enterica]